MQCIEEGDDVEAVEWLCELDPEGPTLFPEWSRSKKVVWVNLVVPPESYRMFVPENEKEFDHLLNNLWQNLWFKVLRSDVEHLLRDSSI